MMKLIPQIRRTGPGLGKTHLQWAIACIHDGSERFGSLGSSLLVAGMYNSAATSSRDRVYYELLLDTRALSEHVTNSTDTTNDALLPQFRR